MSSPFSRFQTSASGILQPLRNISEDMWFGAEIPPAPPSPVTPIIPATKSPGPPFTVTLSQLDYVDVITIDPPPLILVPRFPQQKVTQ